MVSNPKPPAAAGDPDDHLIDHDGLAFEVIEEEQAASGRVRRRGIYLIPNAITTLALLSGFYSIISSSHGEFDRAIYAIFLAALFDGMDGRVARMTGAQSPFGEQYDSLSDMLSFGVAPALLIYHFALSGYGRIGLACAFLYTACAAFRLARFNVQIGSVDKRFFIGLASPLAAILVACGCWVILDNPSLFQGYESLWKTALAALSVLAGLLMVSNFRYYSFKSMGGKRVPFIALLGLVVVLLMVTQDLPIGLTVIAVIYTFSGIIYSLMRPARAPSMNPAGRQ